MVSVFKGDLGNALYEFSGVLQVGIQSSLQCVQYPDQIPARWWVGEPMAETIGQRGVPLLDF